jgi:hypothetical protein
MPDPTTQADAIDKLPPLLSDSPMPRIYLLPRRWGRKG